MLRRLACAVAILGLTLTFANAEDIKGTIVKVGEGKVTIRLKAAEKGKKGEEKTFDLAKDCKVCQMEGKDKKELADGLKSDVLSKADGKKGIGGMIVTNADNKVTEIVVGGKKKKKGT